MQFLCACIFLALIVTFVTTHSIPPVGSDSDELLLVHVLFRHGNRAIEDNIYTGNPYGDESFYQPFGYGQLTNEGKRTEYKIGQELRSRYDSFLGDEYNINLIDARVDGANRTKMSLLMVTASLFPPSGDLLWNNSINWQPVPYNTYDVDKELAGHKVCTNYKKDYKKLIKTDEIQAKLVQYQDMFEYVSNHTLLDISKPKKASDLYGELLTQQLYGYPLEDWTNKYIAQLKQITLDNYGFMTYKKKLKRVISGFLIRKIIADTESKISDLPQTKMYLYSGHEKNVASLLSTLGFSLPDTIPFGGYVLIEVHRIDGIYGIKLYYQNYAEEDPTLMTIPGCSEFCPLDDFKNIVSDYIPDDTDCEL